jgi:ribose transport system permease protein
MTFVIVTAGIDLSVGSTMALAGVCCVKAVRGLTFPAAEASTTTGVGVAVALVVGLCVAGRLVRGGRGAAAGTARVVAVAGGAGCGAGAVAALLWLALAGRAFAPASPLVAALVGIGAGALVGLVNGGLVTSLGLPPFIVTLATLESVRGLVLLVSGGTPVSPDDAWPAAAVAGLDALERLHSGAFQLRLGGVPLSPALAPNLWLALLVAAIGVPLLHLSVLGRYAYAIGSSERTARLCGVAVERYKAACYMIAGATAGLAGVMMAAKFRGGQPSEFAGAELTVIAAVVIGGTSLFGGEGTVAGTLLGVLMLGLLYSGCVLAGISSFVQRIFIGGTIVLAAGLDRFRHGRG